MPAPLEPASLRGPVSVEPLRSSVTQPAAMVIALVLSVAIARLPVRSQFPDALMVNGSEFIGVRGSAIPWSVRAILSASSCGVLFELSTAPAGGLSWPPRAAL